MRRGKRAESTQDLLGKIGTLATAGECSIFAFCSPSLEARVDGGRGRSPCDSAESVTAGDFQCPLMLHTAAMEHKEKVSRVRRVATAAVLAAAILVPAHAAEKINLDRLARRYSGRIENRSMTVVTRDGKKHHTRSLGICADGVLLDYGQNKATVVLSGPEVARIEIRQTGRYFSRLTDRAKAPVAFGLLVCGGFDTPTPCNPIVFAGALTLVSPYWAYAAVAAPVDLAAEAGAFFVPSKTFDIVP
jgi:hypothetical protein